MQEGKLCIYQDSHWSHKINSTPLTFRNNIVIKQLKRLNIFAAGPNGRAV